MNTKKPSVLWTEGFFSVNAGQDPGSRSLNLGETIA